MVHIQVVHYVWKHSNINLLWLNSCVLNTMALTLLRFKVYLTLRILHCLWDAVFRG